MRCFLGLVFVPSGGLVPIAHRGRGLATGPRPVTLAAPPALRLVVVGLGLAPVLPSPSSRLQLAVWGGPAAWSVQPAGSMVTLVSCSSVSRPGLHRPPQRRTVGHPAYSGIGRPRRHDHHRVLLLWSPPRRRGSGGAGGRRARRVPHPHARGRGVAGEQGGGQQRRFLLRQPLALAGRRHRDPGGLVCNPPGAMVGVPGPPLLPAAEAESQRGLVSGNAGVLNDPGAWACLLYRQWRCLHTIHS